MIYKENSVNVNNLSFSYAEISSGIYKNQGLTEYLEKTLDFCKDWLSGKEKFTISTSGSTGNPKIIEISAEQIKVSAQMTIKALGLKPNDKALVCLNTSYIAGMMMLVRGMVGKLSLNIIEPISNPFLNLDPFYIPVDFVALVPLQLSAALSDPDSRKKLLKVKSIIIGGAPVTATLEDECKNLPSAIYETYGMTETVSHIALRRLNGPERSNCFKVLPGVEIDTDSRECLKIRGALTNYEWLITNDKVKLVDHKTFEWLGRVDNVINSGGIKIQTESLEKKIFPMLKKLNINHQFFIASLPHPTLGEAIILFLEGKDSVSGIEILNKEFSEKLNKYEVPKEVIFLKNFNQTPTGKIQRKETMKKYLNQNRK
ncbi:AMP-binding protein [soil metagenome]